MEKIIDQIQSIKLKLGRERQMVAVAESLTAGRIQALLSSISGSSDFFAGGLTAYNLEQKVRQLGVDRQAAAAVNCVSQGVVEQMAMGVIRLFESDFSVATTGYAEPYPEEKIEKPFAWIAVATQKRGIVRVEKHEMNFSDRQTSQLDVAEKAVELLSDVVNR